MPEGERATGWGHFGVLSGVREISVGGGAFQGEGPLSAKVLRWAVPGESVPKGQREGQW